MTVDSTTLITPGMKIAELLDAHPQLEDVLIELAPAFTKLRNPVLRTTVARVATLERAAAMAGMPVRDLVIQLRSAVGQPTDRDDPTASPAPTACGCFHPAENEPVGLTVNADQNAGQDDPPAWLREERVTRTIDAAAILAAGQVPLRPVLQAAESLGVSEILRITVDFRPIPLIKMLERKGFVTCARQVGVDQFELFITKMADGEREGETAPGAH
jgi:hypothetical protein